MTKSRCLLILVAGVLTACDSKHGQVTLRQPVEGSQGKTVHVDGRADDRDRQVSQEATPSEERIEELFRGLGMRFTRGSEEEAMANLVTEHMKRANLPLPPRHRFVIWRRSGHWVIAVADMEAILQGKRTGGPAYHIGTKDGKAQILFAEAGL